MTMSDEIEVTDRQRERIEQIKQECTEGGSVPEPTDGEVIDSLLDTWDAVNDGHYTAELIAELETLVEGWNENAERRAKLNSDWFAAGAAECASDISELIKEHGQ